MSNEASRPIGAAPICREGERGPTRSLAVIQPCQAPYGPWAAVRWSRVRDKDNGTRHALMLHITHISHLVQTWDLSLQPHYLGNGPFEASRTSLHRLPQQPRIFYGPKSNFWDAEDVSDSESSEGNTALEGSDDDDGENLYDLIEMESTDDEDDGMGPLKGPKVDI
ncbi:hypothetical protein M408DRAFT_28151 [Serendipita vermifera MAFF 305830]|uniref:Uncharacterized protein n=1 Tax=Serendipita vermifera MAFF 305830 TaxID=933852 RepID=A0A0C2X0Y1_SERVB|nr:hypothetical protein M408DRAFT_28151 [Serendipita vermifera MAFF 305830]